MELIDQHTKQIMEECKVRARAVGLQISGDTLEYIATNRDLIELKPKIMIPTLYDYWVDDVEVIRDKWLYDAFPYNPYETVVNTRPAISFYNDNNPDWLNVMIFYHVLGHIDFFQNNIFYRKTWDDDFCGQALADKRFINRIREEMGQEKRWVDYVIEFARGIDNLVGYYRELEEADRVQTQNVFGALSEKASFYFGEFSRKRYEAGTMGLKLFYDEVDRYNRCLEQHSLERAEEAFFGDYQFRGRFPEFASLFEKRQKQETVEVKDVLQHLVEHSEFINKEKNKWMKDVVQVARRTSLYFEAQMRDKICHEGWASLWHERLFITDERIRGHRADFAVVNSRVMLIPRIGFNPYVIGMRLWDFIEESASRGKLSYAFQLLKNLEARDSFNQKLGPEYGRRVLLGARRNFNDSLLINFLSDDDFQDFVNRHNLFIAGTRPSRTRHGFAELYIKSRSGKEYRKMLNKSLYHPPYILISEEKAKEGELYLDHVFEGRTLVTKYIPAVLRGLSYFHGGRVRLETTEFELDQDIPRQLLLAQDPDNKPRYRKLRVLYTCEGRRIERDVVIGENWQEAAYG